MKIEQRKILVTQNVYVACDGTVFADIDTCGEYEVQLLEEELDMYTIHRARTTRADECFYAKLDTADKVSKFMTALEHYGIDTDGLKQPGIYMYTGRHRDDTWVNLTSVMADLEGSENV